MIITLGTTPAVQKTMVFERLKIDDVNRTADVSCFASGKAINAARVLHTLGKPVLALGFAGGDSGVFFSRDLESAGIEADVVEVPTATRTATTLIDRSAGTATELVEESHCVEPSYFDSLLERLQLRLAEARLVLLCGSLTPGAPPDFYARCVAACRRANVPALLDAVGEPLRQALAERPTLVKPNRTELAQTVGFDIVSDADVKRGIAELLSRGPQWAVVTNGREPAIASDGHTFWSISTPTVPVVSAIGSGDSFAAGLAAALYDGKSIAEACRLAAACGAANAMTPRAGHLSKPEAIHLATKVRVAEL